MPEVETCICIGKNDPFFKYSDFSPISHLSVRKIIIKPCLDVWLSNIIPAFGSGDQVSIPSVES